MDKYTIDKLNGCRAFYMKKVKAILAGHGLYKKNKPRPDFDLICDFARIVNEAPPTKDKSLEFLAGYFGWHHIDKVTTKARSNSARVTGFYTSPQWAKLRSQVLRLYGRKCMRCNVTHTIIHVDHITPRSKDRARELDITNLQVLCKACNEAKGHTDSTDYRRPVHIEALSRHLNG